MCAYEFVGANGWTFGTNALDCINAQVGVRVTSRPGSGRDVAELNHLMYIYIKV